MFQCVILAGGFGTRLKSVSGDIPKPMVPIGNEPFLYLLMRKLEQQGCSKIILSLHYKADFIINRIDSDRPVSCPVEYSVEDLPLGTGGALKRSSRLISEPRFIALNGDTYCDIDYASLLIAAESTDLLVAAVNVDNVQRYGKLEIDDTSAVLSMGEKSKEGEGFINAGTYVIKTDDIAKFSMEEFSFENDFIPNFRGNFKAYIAGNNFVDIGIPSDYQYACRILV
jgi:D-glycero-alpha-D-manno-heptose 1-phosphate guanylyltransferase